MKKILCAAITVMLIAVSCAGCANTNGKFTVKINGTEAYALTYGSKIEEPDLPEINSDDGYEYAFIGWFNNGARWDFENDTVIGNVNLISEFEKTPIRYSVRFIADGVQVGETQYYTVENKTVNEPKVPIKKGYSGVWKNYTLTKGDVTVYAEYSEDDWGDFVTK